MAEPLTTDQVEAIAWALHCLNCDLCAANRAHTLTTINRDHLTTTDRQQAEYLVAWVSN